MRKPIYSIILEDDTVFVGGCDYSDTKWSEIPIGKKIKRIFYKLPIGDILLLSGGDKYCHLVEVTKDLNGAKSGKVNLEYAYIMKQKDNTVTCYKMNLQNKELILCKEYDINDEFIKGISISSWK